MKLIICLIALLGSMGCMAQFNPDADGNGQIDIIDLMAFLEYYGEEFTAPSNSACELSIGYINITAPETGIVDVPVDFDIVVVSGVQSWFDGVQLPETYIEGKTLRIVCDSSISSFSIYFYEAGGVLDYKQISYQRFMDFFYLNGVWHPLDWDA